MKSWTVDPEIARQVRERLLRGDQASPLEDFAEIRPRVQSLAELLIPDVRPVRATILDDVAFSVRLGAYRNDAARCAYRTLVPSGAKKRIDVEHYIERCTAVGSLTASVDALLGFYDPWTDMVCLRAMPVPRVVEVALEHEVRRFFRRELPAPYRWLPEGTSDSTSMEHAMATIVLRRYLDPILRPRTTLFKPSGDRTWSDVFDGDTEAIRTFAGDASQKFLASLVQHYDFASREHLARIDASYVDELISQ